MLNLGIKYFWHSFDTRQHILITFDDSTVCLYNKENFEINSDTDPKLRLVKDELQALNILERTDDHRCVIFTKDYQIWFILPDKDKKIIKLLCWNELSNEESIIERLTFSSDGAVTKMDWKITRDCIIISIPLEDKNDNEITIVHLRNCEIVRKMSFSKSIWDKDFGRGLHRHRFTFQNLAYFCLLAKHKIAIYSQFGEHLHTLQYKGMKHKIEFYKEVIILGYSGKDDGDILSFEYLDLERLEVEKRSIDFDGFKNVLERHSLPLKKMFRLNRKVSVNGSIIVFELMFGFEFLKYQCGLFSCDLEVWRVDSRP